MQRTYKLRDVQERLEDLGGSELRKSGKDYMFNFHGRRIGVFVTHEGSIPDHGIKQITDGMISVYKQEKPDLKESQIHTLRTEIMEELKGRAKPYRETVSLGDLGSALKLLDAPVSYENHKLKVLMGDKSVYVTADKNDEVPKYEFNAIVERVAVFYGTDLRDVLRHLPKPRKRSTGLEVLLGKTAVVLAAFALFTALVWTGSTYTGAIATSVGYKVGYYGIIAIIISFYALVMFFHKLHSE